MSDVTIVLCTMCLPIVLSASPILRIALHTGVSDAYYAYSPEYYIHTYGVPHTAVTGLVLHT